jgi:hypothetical protein
MGDGPDRGGAGAVSKWRSHWASAAQRGYGPVLRSACDIQTVREILFGIMVAGGGGVSAFTCRYMRMTVPSTAGPSFCCVPGPWLIACVPGPWLIAPSSAAAPPSEVVR